MAAVSAVVALVCVDLAAQRPSQRRPDGASVEESAPINNLIDRARDAIARQDWKFAIDSLQRIIDRPEGALLLRRSGLYESSRRFAERTLAELPPAGLAAYRVLYDGQAQRLFDEAVRQHDPAILGQVTNRFLLTHVGDQAAALLSSWLLDRDHPGEALAVLDRLSSLCRDTEVPVSVIATRAAVANAMLQDREQALAILNQAGDRLSTESRDQLSKLIDELLDQNNEAWPGPAIAGRAYHGGHTQAIEPSLVVDLPWRHPLPGSQPSDWTHLLERQENHLPAAQALVADGRLFIKGAGPCAAFDLQSFAPLWKAQPPVEGLAERLRRFQRQLLPRQRVGRSNRLSRLDRLSYDYVTASISVYDDLVLTLEPTGSGQSFDAQGIMVRQRHGPQVATGNRLVAYDVQTGQVRWQRGRSGDPDDPLGQVDFLAPPESARDQLWAPVLIHGDLHLVVLDPANGNLLHKINLCTPLAGRMSLSAPLWPVVAGGTLYLATGQGLLFAVSTADYLPRWAVRYPRNALVRRRSSYPNHTAWLPTPPLVSGSFVLLAPTDSDSLMAFDRVTGEPRWERQRDKHRYIVALDNTRVWLAGEKLACVSLPTGDLLWKTSHIAATGRAALAGGRIYVPTSTGLARFDAATGQRLANDPLPADEQPLGNLLVLDDSLISIDAYEVRKYPDVRRSYQRARLAQQSDPSAAGPAIKLARLELIADQPQQALQVLDQVQPQDDANGRLLVHLKVEALLALASAPDRSARQALPYLQRAVTTSVTDIDILSASLALADALQRAGRLEEAYRRLWNLADMPAAGLRLVTPNQARRQARSILAEKLRALENALPAQALANITAGIAARFQASVRELGKARWNTTAARTLRRLAQTSAPGGWGQASLIALANWQRRNGRFEPAEQDYLAAIRSDDLPRHTAAALAGLARMYLQPEQSLPVQATALLDRLEQEFADQKLDWLDPDGTTQMRTGRQVAQALRTQVDPNLLADHRWTLSPGPFELVEASVWTQDIQDDSTQLLTLLSLDCEAIADRILVSRSDRTLRAYRLADGMLEWEADLRLPDEQVGLDLLTSQMPTVGQLHFAVADGQTALVRTANSLHAFGLITGKRLWSVPQFDSSARGAKSIPAGLLWAQQGRVACLPEPNQLAVLDVRDGATLWSRRLESSSVAHVRIVDDFVVLTNDERTRAWVFALDDGDPTATLTFTQDDSTDHVVGPARAQGLLCGPDGNAVIAYELATGRVRWRVDVPGDLVRIFAAGTDRIGIGTLGGRFKWLDAQTGRVLLDRLLPNCRNGVVDGAWDGQNLLVGGIIDTPAGRRPVLLGLDATTGDVLWKRQDLALYARRPWFFQMADGVVPALIQQTELGDIERGHRRRSRNRPIALVIIDARTGKNIGPSFGQNQDGERLTGDLEIRAGCLAVGTSRGVRMVKIKPSVEMQAQ